MIRSQKIRIYPNNKQITFIEKSFGVSRFTYNWILEEYNKDSSNFDILKLKKKFNSLKKEKYPFTYEVSKYASQEPFMDFKDALRSLYRKDGCYKHLHFKSKKDVTQSFYIGGDQIKIINKDGSNKDYLKLPKMTTLKLNEHLRFSGHIIGCRITRKFDKYYVSINIDVEMKEVTSRNDDSTIGIDVGIKNNMTLSNGLFINYPISINKHIKKIIRIQKNLSRKVHPRTKDDPKLYSKNYLKEKKKLDNELERLDNIKKDFEHKVSYLLTNYYRYISIEDLSLKKMKEDKNIARKLQQLGLYRFRSLLEYKSKLYGSEVIIADKYYPSSKICSKCGNKNDALKLSDRIYRCQCCNNIIDRDINAAINLKKLVGRVTSELKPFDLDVLIEKLKKSKIDIFKVEEGNQQKIHL